MRSLPNIFKSFWKPAAAAYVLPDAEELEVEDPREEAEEPSQAAPEAPEAESPPDEPADRLDQEREFAVQAISFAQVQAEKILNDARRQGEALVEQSRREAAEEIERQKSEARADGFRQGYAEGLRKAQLEAQAQLEQQLEENGRQVREFVEKATAAREELIAQTRNELRDLSLAVAEKVIHVSLQSSSEVVARMIQSATEKLKRREWVHIYLADKDARQIAQAAPELVLALGSLSDHIKFIPMSDNESGTCIIEMPDEIIDASASTQLANIRDLLQEE